MRTLFILVFTIILISCSKNNSFENEIKKYIEKNANDPKSYELIDFKIIDTITVGMQSNILILINNSKLYEKLNDSLDLELLQLKNLMYYTKTKSSEWKDLVDETSKMIEKNNTGILNLKNENSELKKNIGFKEILGFKTRLNCRMKNENGTLEKFEYISLFDENKKILIFELKSNDEIDSIFRNEILNKEIIK